MLMRPAMLNFICQFDWTIIYPDIWLNIIFGVCLWGCLWEKLASEFVNWVSRWTLPIVGGCHLIHLGLNRIKRSRKFDVLLPTCWTNTCSFALCASGSQACRCVLESTLSVTSLAPTPSNYSTSCPRTTLPKQNYSCRGCKHGSFLLTFRINGDTITYKYYF